MHMLHVHYRNTQGTLMRILNAVSRRGIELPYVQAEPLGPTHRVALLLDLHPKQVGQLNRDWRAIADVMDVRAGVPTEHVLDLTDSWAAAAHRPATVSASELARSATA